MSTYNPPTYDETWHEGGYTVPPFAEIAREARDWPHCLTLMDKALNRKPGVVGSVWMEIAWWQSLAWQAEVDAEVLRLSRMVEIELAAHLAGLLRDMDQQQRIARNDRNDPATRRRAKDQVRALREKVRRVELATRCASVPEIKHKEGGGW